MENRNRLIFLDILRAIGVMLMIEGHTLDAVLSPLYRDGSTFMFQLWTFFRGLTAPFFFFSAGLAFVVATVKNDFGGLSISNRTKSRRIRRIATLLLLGYGLHFPLELLYEPSGVPSYNLKIFFYVDALHVISLSLLVILVIALFAKKAEALLRSYVIAAVLSLAIAPVVEPIRWENFLAPFFYSYLTFRSGSFFTFFPFSAYLFAGASFGAASLTMPIESRSRALSGNFMKASIVSLLLFLVFFPIQLLFVSLYVDYWRALPAINFLRFGIVGLVASMVGYLSLKVRHFPKIIPALGRNSLTIYVVHLMVVYGSPINLGLTQLIPEGTNSAVAILLVVGVVSSMVGMVYGIEAYKVRKRKIEVITVSEIAK
ncbi:MAG TPA: acyltransferase family protein [Candidatus Acidoferrales bacterium]|nr:acyltransferase family protein [Candidatus Acidoferrales bacterium]